MAQINKQILHIAIPSIVSNITVPLLSLVDTTIAGHLGETACIGAIAVGGMIFNMAYWLFSFLRMGTGGLTAQAYGAADHKESKIVLLRSLAVAAAVSFLLIVLQYPIIEVAFSFVSATPEVEHLARQYFSILIWGAPAVLGLYSFTGWFIGMQNARLPMVIAITQNVVNIVVSAVLVFLFHWRVEGIATGTLVAQYAGLGMALTAWCVKYRRIMPSVNWQKVVDRVAFKNFFTINRDIFFRTFCLIAVSTYFTSAGSAQGEVVLAVNTLLMQFFILFSYISDGFAYAGEAIGGKCFGAGNVEDFKRLFRLLVLWGLAFVVLFTAIYVCLGSQLLRLFTNDNVVIRQAVDYLPYACAIPIVSFMAFIYDGLFIGCTATRYMLISMFVASAVFFSIITIFPQSNHVLWLAFLVYLACRGAIQALLYPQVVKKMAIVGGKTN